MNRRDSDCGRRADRLREQLPSRTAIAVLARSEACRFPRSPGQGGLSAGPPWRPP